MTQFNLADELRRGGTGLLAQAVADLRHAVRELNPGLLPDEYWLHNLQARAAAVPAGNQAKTLTALDEMRAVQEGAQPPSNPVEPETTRGQLQRGLDDVANALGRPALLVGEHADAVRRALTESREALARVEAERDALKARVKTAERDSEFAAHQIGLGSCTPTEHYLRLDAVVEAARNALADWEGRYVQTFAGESAPALRAALSALDQAASGPECAQKGHAYATNKGECCIYCFRPKAECLHMGEPASEAEVTERAPEAPSYWVLERRDLAGPAYVAANSEGYHGWTTDTASALRFYTQRDADCHRRARGYDDLVIAAEHQDVSDPEATESATKEAK